MSAAKPTAVPHNYASNHDSGSSGDDREDLKEGLLGYDFVLNETSRIDNKTVKFVHRRFPNAVEDWWGTPITVRERKMIASMNAITDKPEWQIKVFASGIAEKWRKELAEQEHRTGCEELDSCFSGKMFVYCMTELYDYAGRYDAQAFVPALDATATVYKSDIIIHESIKTALQIAVRALEHETQADRDWHPGSDEKVLDLVHPSLFPMLYGRSLICPESIPLRECIFHCGKGMAIVEPEEHELAATLQKCELDMGQNFPDVVYSSRFQWLPAEVSICADGNVKFHSYINNLHPQKHEATYNAIEKVIAKIIPMWNATLSSMEHKGRPCRIEVPFANCGEPYIEPDYEEESDMFVVPDYIMEARVLLQPEPGSYGDRKNPTGVYVPTALTPAPGLNTDCFTHPASKTPRQLGDIDLSRDFGGRNVQIIVKLANIHLTPEKPAYDGGKWHVEGSLNEHICASAIYYYDSDNVTDSRLAFRESMDRGFLRNSHEQFCWDHLLPYYDITNDGPAIQDLGQVLTKEGRVVVFPNVVQHCVQPFKLLDAAKPGHRKILALFLVDPNVRIPSTAHVPPQQKEWWSDMVLDLDRVADLPPEVAEHVLDSAGDFPITLKEAKELRLELMQERSTYEANVDAKMTCEGFDFCEH
ncbi:hypothetical protein LTR56_024606 [Elasticomyces elasticus]|nr:hypothetical protein LTR56_024606 [Elasticomyces elasticus]KAK3628250.1 hypothetical protein LTR22_022416 [Elasticomyces elasticus]KAK4908070.1 hypothetical protein LTR49_022968 [Elasticomyces elasticus]KAK5756273.1 hypothetical protein LTS12_013579 [Elasticomyces elasticus]